MFEVILPIFSAVVIAAIVLYCAWTYGIKPMMSYLRKAGYQSAQNTQRLINVSENASENINKLVDTHKLISIANAHGDSTIIGSLIHSLKTNNEYPPFISDNDLCDTDDLISFDFLKESIEDADYDIELAFKKDEMYILQLRKRAVRFFLCIGTRKTSVGYLYDQDKDYSYHYEEECEIVRYCKFICDVRDCTFKEGIMAAIIEESKNSIDVSKKPIIRDNAITIKKAAKTPSGQTYFKSITINAYAKYFKSGFDLAYNNFKKEIEGKIYEILPNDYLNYLSVIIKQGKNIFIEGEPGTGKTSFGNALKNRVANNMPNLDVMVIDASNFGVFKSEAFLNILDDQYCKVPVDEDGVDRNRSLAIFVEDVDGALNMIAMKAGEDEKNSSSSLILDMLDGDFSTRYNVAFICTSNKKLSSYNNILNRRFYEVFEIEALKADKAIKLVENLLTKAYDLELSFIEAEWDKIKSLPAMKLSDIFMKVFVSNKIDEALKALTGVIKNIVANEPVVLPPVSKESELQRTINQLRHNREMINSSYNAGEVSNAKSLTPPEV
jgi:hypothetical protein